MGKVFFRHLKAYLKKEIAGLKRDRRKLLWENMYEFISMPAFFLVYGYILKPHGYTPYSYFRFLLTGLMLWKIAITCMEQSAKSIKKETQHADLLRPLKFNKTIIPIASMAAGLLRVMPAIAAFTLLIATTGTSMIGLAAAILPVIAVSTAIGVIFAYLMALDEIYAEIFKITTRTAYLLAGIFYPLNILPGRIYDIAYSLPYGRMFSIARKSEISEADAAYLLAALLVGAASIAYMSRKIRIPAE